MPDPRYEHFKDFSSGPTPMAERKKIWLEISDMTEAEFDTMMADNNARQAGVPQPGTEAPDFRLERMTRDRKRTGEFVTLSGLRGKPVGLLFGSYT